MKDYLGIDIKEGDVVVYLEAGYRDFHKATVVGFTPQKVKISSIDIRKNNDRGYAVRFGTEVVVVVRG